MMKGEKVVIFGTGSFAECVHYLLTHDSPHEVVAFTVSGDRIEEKEHFGLPILPFEELEQHYPPDAAKLYIAVAYNRLNLTRAEVYGAAKERGYGFITYVSSKCTNWAAEIGENTFIFEDNTLQPFCRIGNNAILWSGNHIGHHSKIGDHCFVTSHVVISGHVEVGPYSFLGVNSTFRDGIKIGEKCLIGAGTLIMKDTKDKEVYLGPRTKPDSRTSDDIRM